MASDQQNFDLPSAGQADWDASINGNFSILEFGYRAKGQAGEDINTGEVVTVASDGFVNRFDPNSHDAKPHLLSMTALSSGDEAFFVSFGSVRSLGVWTGVIPGHDVFVSVFTPGMVVSSYSGANRKVGIAHYEDGFVFQPGASHFPEAIAPVSSIDAVEGSLHLFQMDAGLDGFNRQLHMVGDSADLVEVLFYTNSSRLVGDLLYQTVSGGVTVIGSAVDQAGWPYWNTDPSTYSGLIYGTIMIMSGANVGSDSIGVTLSMERNR